MDWTNKNVHPSKVVQLGDEVEVMILEIDEDRRRISLGMKQCKPNPWEEFAQNHKKGRQGWGCHQVDHRFRYLHRSHRQYRQLGFLSDLSWSQTGEEAIRNFKKVMKSSRCPRYRCRERAHFARNQATKAILHQFHRHP